MGVHSSRFGLATASTSVIALKAKTQKAGFLVKMSSAILPRSLCGGSLRAKPMTSSKRNANRENRRCLAPFSLISRHSRTSSRGLTSVRLNGVAVKRGRDLKWERTEEISRVRKRARQASRRKPLRLERKELTRNLSGREEGGKASIRTERKLVSVCRRPRYFPSQSSLNE